MAASSTLFCSVPMAVRPRRRSMPKKPTGLDSASIQLGLFASHQDSKQQPHAKGNSNSGVRIFAHHGIGCFCAGLRLFLKLAAGFLCGFESRFQTLACLLAAISRRDSVGECGGGSEYPGLIALGQAKSGLRVDDVGVANAVDFDRLLSVARR